MSQEDDLDFLDLPEFLTGHSPVRCGTYLFPMLSGRERRADKFVHRFLRKQYEKIRAGDEIRLPKPLRSRIKRLALETDLDL